MTKLVKEILETLVSIQLKNYYNPIWWLVNTETPLSLLLSKTLMVRTYRATSFPLVLYGSETWSLTLRDEHKLQVFENKVLKIFRCKKDEVNEQFRIFHNKELGGLYRLQILSE